MKNIIFLSFQYQPQISPVLSIYIGCKSGVTFVRRCSRDVKTRTRSKEVNLSRAMRKLDFRRCENKDADQLCGNSTADQFLCFRSIDSTIPLLLKFEISSLLASSMVVQTGLCRTWSDTPKTGFLTVMLIYCLSHVMRNQLFPYMRKQRRRSAGVQ